MQQPATAFFICSQCNAAYDSDTSLRNHKFSAHRWSGSDQLAGKLAFGVLHGEALTVHEIAQGIYAAQLQDRVAHELMEGTAAMLTTAGLPPSFKKPGCCME